MEVDHLDDFKQRPQTYSQILKRILVVIGVFGVSRKTLLFLEYVEKRLGGQVLTERDSCSSRFRLGLSLEILKKKFRKLKYILSLLRLGRFL